MCESIRGRITGNGIHNLFKGWEDIDGHILSHKGPLVWKIYEGFQVKEGSDKEAILRNHLYGGQSSAGEIGKGMEGIEKNC